jgi:myo-inositol 2-dehydrogenase/D-chiro-inositol 1-dehydrogenase
MIEKRKRMMDKVNLGIIGAGRIGRIHARNLKFQIPGARLAAISDVIEKSARQAAAELEIPVCEQDYRRLLDNKELDAVVICSSTDTHAKLIVEAAQAGKDVFCEKPVALDLKLIEQALQTVDQAHVKFMVGFNRRFDPSFKKARDLVATGKIGTPHLVRISSRDPEPPPPAYVKVSGGLFLDMMIHDFDMARYLLGEEITELMATGNCLVDPEISRLGDVDTAVVLLKYQSGALGAIDNSRKAIYGYDQRIEVFGSAGSVVVGNKTPTQVTLNHVDAVQNDKPLYFFLERYQESYLAEMDHFVQAILNDSQPSVGGRDGMIAVRMGYAAKESLASRTFAAVK